ncbi:MAG TPA: RluA family pseudouridine synthase [Chitinispirillaceae bacterium]|nr:RluA family pseudouridine synthase [Chitinispirillaceae bacterium]
MVKILIGSEQSGSRLDRLLRKRFALLTLSEIYALIRKGKVRIDGKKAKQDQRLVEGSLLEVDIDPSEETKPSGPDASLKSIVKTDFFRRNFHIIYEDDDLLACNKPAGLVVHPGTGHLHRDTLIELATGYLIDKGCLKEGDEPALVHRLDRDTSGVILIAKNKNCVRKLHEIFRSRDIIKQYIALCHHRPPQYEGEIVVGMARSFENSGTKMKVDEDGQVSKSHYRIVEYNNILSKLEVLLETGKTHQIRVHLAHIGAPIVGDERYGNPDLDKSVLNRKRNRLYLHSFRIIFNHPVKNRKITLEAVEPIEFHDLMK